MSKSTFYPVNIQPGDAEEVVDAVNMVFLDVKKTLDTLGIAKGIVVTIADSGASATEFAVAHGLGVVPDSYMKVRASDACELYDGDTAWDGNNIYLKCSAANVALSILVVINTN